MDGFIKYSAQVCIEEVAMEGGGSVGELSQSERYLELLGPLKTSTSVFGMFWLRDLRVRLTWVLIWWI